MDLEILNQLRQNNKPRDWEELKPMMEPPKTGKFNDNPVYEFFYTLTDSLEINPQSIGVSVQPVKSYIPFHIHNYVEITVPLLGECTVVTNKEEILVSQNNIIIIGNHTTHTVKPIEDGAIVVNISLKGSAFTLNDFNFMQQKASGQNISNMLFSLLSNENLGENTYSLFKTSHVVPIINSIYDIISEYYHPDIQTNQIIRLEILTLFSRLIRAASKSNANIKINNKASGNNLLSLLLYIERNYANITLEQMGHHFGFNPNYLSNYLKTQTGMSFIQLVHLQRVNVAAEYLVYTTAPIDQISLKIGYENPSYFYKIFKKILNSSPSEYRKEHQV
ncbi:AraC family transcriptional regulator [Xylocopilactobacillus apis]|uniref:AraC family transcriptional regulator n=1 Tax=Xylocopilactobacillus apis TaxID=2932183 RepID=A0AAU9CRR6_9LACO|nr:helix-turn-helix domain-containing protein [Xylocopilactobacillus apis]BDR56632.1 AraC family transcriptional regulator [Xylocopilactobacillus apis]